MNGCHLTGYLLFTVQTLQNALNDIWLSTNEGRIRDKDDPVHDRGAYTGSGGTSPLILKLDTGQIQAPAALSQEKNSLVTIGHNNGWVPGSV